MAAATAANLTSKCWARKATKTTTTKSKTEMETEFERDKKPKSKTLLLSRFVSSQFEPPFFSQRPFGPSGLEAGGEVHSTDWLPSLVGLFWPRTGELRPPPPSPKRMQSGIQLGHKTGEGLRGEIGACLAC